MPFKLVISDPETAKAIQYELDDAKTNVLVGKAVGEIVEGDALGLPGYKLKITGGSDRSGFPIRPDVHGSGKNEFSSEVLLASSPREMESLEERWSVAEN